MIHKALEKVKVPVVAVVDQQVRIDQSKDDGSDANEESKNAVEAKSELKRK